VPRHYRPNSHALNLFPLIVPVSTIGITVRDYTTRELRQFYAAIVLCNAWDILGNIFFLSKIIKIGFKFSVDFEGIDLFPKARGSGIRN
jgi:hypothetical protein